MRAEKYVVFSIACKDYNKASRRITDLNTDVHMSLTTRDVPVSTSMGRLTRRRAGQDSDRGATASASAPPSASSSAPAAGPAVACVAALLRPSCTAARVPPACGHDSERMWTCACDVVNVPRREYVAGRAHERGVSKSKFYWRRAASVESLPNFAHSCPFPSLSCFAAAPHHPQAGSACCGARQGASAELARCAAPPQHQCRPHAQLPAGGRHVTRRERAPARSGSGPSKQGQGQVQGRQQGAWPARRACRCSQAPGRPAGLPRRCRPRQRAGQVPAGQAAPGGCCCRSPAAPSWNSC